MTVLDTTGIVDVDVSQYPRTRAEVLAYPYAQLGVRLPSMPPSILTLTALDGDVETWLSSESSAVIIRDGRVMALETPRLSYRVTAISPADPLTRLLQLEPPSDAPYELHIEVGTDAERRKLNVRCAVEVLDTREMIDVQGVRPEATRIVERCEGDGETLTNQYWMAGSDPHVWKAELQNPQDRSVIRYDVLKRPV